LTISPKTSDASVFNFVNVVGSVTALIIACEYIKTNLDKEEEEEENIFSIKKDQKDKYEYI